MHSRPPLWRPVSNSGSRSLQLAPIDNLERVLLRGLVLQMPSGRRLKVRYLVDRLAGVICLSCRLGPVSALRQPALIVDY